MNTRFSDALRARKKAGFTPVIPDFKAISPQHGDLFRGRDPLETARRLMREGATALSVVTEPEAFGGSLDLLRRMVSETGLPVLRKDFITSPEDLKITRACGAEAVLLICAMHTLSALTALYDTAMSMGLEPLVEAHTQEELGWAAQLGARLVGINNRDILALERDGGTVSATASLAGHAPRNAFLVSESAIGTAAEAQAAIRAGVDAVLVGTALWQAADMGACYRALCAGSGAAGEDAP
jgi:indole-3-glycerol phosphate synthase